MSSTVRWQWRTEIGRKSAENGLPGAKTLRKIRDAVALGRGTTPTSPADGDV